ncbi:MAG TPA: hypothetical protein VHJ99_16330 [Candidatus Dormibacteraeota bacterium]|nr:hypothetical protein [Candidatus Dormibacteraeota bacterium]
MTTLRWRRAVLTAALMATIMAACASTSSASPAPPAPGDLIWPSPGNPLELTVKAGLQPETKETLTFHVHAHLDVFIDRRPVLVPSGIGINITDPAVKHGQWNGGPTYGGIEGCAQPCISPLHTHYESGVIHTESSNPIPHRLGQFFTEWDVTLTGTCVGQYCEPATTIVVYVDGQRYSGNVADITLTDRKEIAVIIGSPPKEIPNSYPSWASG